MEELLIFGHQNPDTDSICSTLAYQEIKNQMGIETKACRIGAISEETQYVLDYLKLEAPVLIADVESKNVILVDHNEFQQSANQIEKANIIEVIDHHRINNFHTENAIYMNIQPVGCTATILYEIALVNNIEITKKLAILLLSALVSDSLLFKSPTYTKKDEAVVKKLVKLIDFDIYEYGLELLKAGTKFDKFSAREIINIDTKEFTIDKGKLEVAQVNTVNIDEFLEKYEKNIIKEISNKINESSLALHVLLVTDIVNNNSLALVNGSISDYFGNSLNVKIVDNKVFLPGVVSRKKQVVPFL